MFSTTLNDDLMVQKLWSDSSSYNSLKSIVGTIYFLFISPAGDDSIYLTNRFEFTFRASTHVVSTTLEKFEGLRVMAT